MAPVSTPVKRVALADWEWKSGSDNLEGISRSGPRREKVRCSESRYRYKQPFQQLLNNPFADRVENQFGNPMKIQLLEYVAAVRIHCVNTYLKEIGYFLVGSAFRNELQDLSF